MKSAMKIAITITMKITITITIAITITLIIDMTIRRDAAIGVAQAERDAGVREAECLMQCEQVFIIMMMMGILRLMMMLVRVKVILLLVTSLFFSGQEFYSVKD